MKFISQVLFLASTMIFPFSGIAADKVVVVPMSSAPGNAMESDVIAGKTFSSREGKGLIGALELPPAPTGDAVAADVLEGKTFSNKDDIDIPGLMINNGALTINPGIADQTVPEGYHNGSGKVKGDANLLPENIKTSTTIFGVTGTLLESSGTATADQVLEGKTYSNASGPATGTMPNVGTQIITPGTSDQTISQGYHDGTGNVLGDSDLTSGNIKSGTNIFGIDGDSYVVNTGSGDAFGNEILSGKKAWVDGSELTGTMPNIGSQIIVPSTTPHIISKGYHNGTGTVSGDIDLVTGNIKSGVNIFGINGDSNVVNTSTGDASANEILNGKKAWVDGSELTGTLPNIGSQNITPGTSDQSINQGYHDGTGTVAGDNDLISNNIKHGVNLFGVTGSLVVSPVWGCTDISWTSTKCETDCASTGIDPDTCYYSCSQRLWSTEYIVCEECRALGICN